MVKIALIAALIVLGFILCVLLVAPAFAADDDSVQVYLAFVFFKTDQGQEKTIIIGSDSMATCQEAFKATLNGIGGDANDFAVAGCKPYLLSNLPKS